MFFEAYPAARFSAWSASWPRVCAHPYLIQNFQKKLNFVEFKLILERISHKKHDFEKNVRQKTENFGKKVHLAVYAKIEIFKF